MEKYHRKLNLPVSPLREDINYTDYRKRQEVLTRDVINLEFKKFCNDRGISLGYVEIFYRKPGDDAVIHCDWIGGDYCKINWYWGGTGSVMEWYELKPEFQDDNRKLGVSPTANTPLKIYKEDEVDLVHTVTSMSGPNLVNNGAIHNVKNPLEERWCLCFSLAYLNDIHKRMPIGVAAEILKDFII
jgi:hypothetical protein